MADASSINNTNANIINTLKAGSGIDTSKLVGQLVEAEQLPTLNALKAREDRAKAEISAYGKLRGSLDTLRSSIKALGENDLFNVRSVALPDSTTITANKVAPGAQPGSYELEVTQIASAQSLATAAQGERDGALGKSGNLTIRFGEWGYDAGGAPQSFAANADKASLTVEVQAGDSLDSIAAKINEQKAGVSASVLKVDGQYQLMLSSASGQRNAMEISVDDASLNDFAFNAANHGNVIETRKAQDAEMKVNGLAVTRETNHITDVIDGLDFTINKAAPGEQLNFSVSEDKSAAEKAIRDFVEAYNTFYKAASDMVGYSKGENDELIRGDLANDSSARTMISRLRSAITNALPGGTEGFNALTNIGIRTARDGTLSIEDKKNEFSNAIKNNFDQIEKLFAPNLKSNSTAVKPALGTYSSNAVGGDYTVEITQDPTRGNLTGNAVTSAGFDATSETFTAPLDTTGGSYKFQVSVNGTQSNEIALNGVYHNAEELRADLQARINGDDKLKGTGQTVDVLYDADTDSFTFTSREYGSTSKVSLSNTSDEMKTLGIDQAIAGTDGQNVKGTINGKEGFGLGEILLPDLKSDAYGLHFTVSEGATAQGAATVNFSRGLAGEIDKLIGGFLGDEGMIKTREDNLSKQVKQIGAEREQFQERMDAYRARLVVQFSAMDMIVSSLQKTGGMLDGIGDRLPFTSGS